MKKAFIILGVLGALAASGRAAAIQDWSQFDLGSRVGTYADDAGSKVEAAQVEGPAKGEKAVRLSSNLVKWGGLWALAGADLSNAGGLRFKAKATKPGRLLVSLTDAEKVQVEATVRVLDGAWQEFEVPMGLFKKAAWQMPEAPKDAGFNFAKVVSINLSARGTGASEYVVGPVSVVQGTAKAKLGAGGDGKSVMAQDFELLEAGAWGVFTDEKAGSKASMELVEGEAKAGKAAEVSYELKPGGWCGVWMRAGDEWGGQDWGGARALELRVSTDKPLVIELAFNDANQCAYNALAAATRGKGWETLSIPVKAFTLNQWYQPPQAKKGAALDLSRVETFNLAPKTEGKGSFRVDSVRVLK